jgi:hypothetical protein
MRQYLFWSTCRVPRWTSWHASLKMILERPTGKQSKTRAGAERFRRFYILGLWNGRTEGCKSLWTGRIPHLVLRYVRYGGDEALLFPSLRVDFEKRRMVPVHPTWPL